LDKLVIALEMLSPNWFFQFEDANFINQQDGAGAFA